MTVDKATLAELAAVTAASLERALAPFAQQVETGFRDLAQRLDAVERLGTRSAESLVLLAAETRAGFARVGSRLDALEARLTLIEDRVASMDDRLARLVRGATTARTGDVERLASLESRLLKLEAALRAAGIEV